MSEHDWGTVPGDVRLFCGRAKAGRYYRTANHMTKPDPQYCSKPATKILQQRCGCGECDMSIVCCDEHAAEYDHA